VGTIRSLSLQMAFARRLKKVTCDITYISSLEENRKYPTEHADRVITRFGETILLSIRDVAVDRLCKVFLPNVTPPCSRTTMYWPLMTDSPFDIWFRRVDAQIRTHTNWLLSRLVLVFRWICPWPDSASRFQNFFSRTTCGLYQKNSKMCRYVYQSQTLFEIVA